MRKIIGILCTLALACSFLQAQPWLRNYGESRPDLLFDFLITDQGNILATGSTDNNFNVESDPLFFRAETDGDSLEWGTFYRGGLQNLYDIEPAQGGGYIAVGAETDSVSGELKPLFVRLDSACNPIWTFTRAGLGNAVTIEAVIELPDSSFVGVGHAEQPGGDIRLVFMKVNKHGNLTPALGVYGTQGAHYGRDILALPNGNFLIVGETDTFSVASKILLMEVDSLAQVISHTSVQAPNRQFATQAHLLQNGDVAVVGIEAVGANRMGMLLRTPQSGSPATSFTFGGAGTDQFFALDTVPGGGFILAGATTSSGNGQFDAWLVRTDASGTALWQQTYGKAEDEEFRAVMAIDSGGFLAAGSMEIGSATQALLAHVDSLGNAPENRLEGHVFDDTGSSNCVQGAGEPDLSGWVVEVLPDGLYTTTDANGDFAIHVDTGTHFINILPPNANWAALSCGSDTVTVTGPCQTISNLNYAFKNLGLCEGLAVDISPLFIIRCDTTRYFVDYCNEGNLQVDSPWIEITLDTTLTFLGTNFPGNFTVNGQDLVFDLDTLFADSCGGFYMDVFVDCDAELGLAHCARAEILPVTSCVDTVGWDLAELEAEITCDLGDTVRVRIENTGTGNMAAPGGVSILEDNIMRVYQDPLQLNVGEDSSYNFVATGGTWIVKVFNNTSHPVVEEFAIYLEGCGTNNQGSFSTEYATSVSPQNDSLSVSIDCRTSTNTLPRIAKVALPTGVGAGHCIELNDAIEYSLIYRNEGTDTVKKITFIDTLSTLLDPTTLHNGVSSHNGNFSIAGNVAVWSFPDIDLPPQRDDTMGSIVMVKFLIELAADSTDFGDTIWNSAWLIENAGFPGRETNRVFHGLCDSLAPLIVGLWDWRPDPEAMITAYPNPFSERLWIDLGGATYRNARLEIWSLGGVLVGERKMKAARRFEIEAGDLPKGMYLFRIYSDENLVGTGKLLRR